MGLYAEKKGIDASETLQNLDKGYFDVYDLAAMCIVRRWVTEDMPPDTFGQIIIDEAQDFGEMVYYVLKRIQPGCYFTIMGDVSQNIHYEMGMNDWDSVREFVFNGKDDSFQIWQRATAIRLKFRSLPAMYWKRHRPGSIKLSR